MNHYYSKTEIKNGKYITINVVETVESEKEIVPVDDTVFKVLATGAYGRIKVTDGYREFTLSNPFTNYFGKVEDARINKQILALNPTFDKVLDMTNAIFDLSPEVMANLHHKVYIGSNAHWVELNEDNLALCV
jgi:hypothetical protein